MAKSSIRPSVRLKNKAKAAKQHMNNQYNNRIKLRTKMDKLK